jgi:hypothetical protein
MVLWAVTTRLDEPNMPLAGLTLRSATTKLKLWLVLSDGSQLALVVLN